MGRREAEVASDYFIKVKPQKCLAICLGSVVVSIQDCHSCDPGSNPGRGVALFYQKSAQKSGSLLRRKTASSERIGQRTKRGVRISGKNENLGCEFESTAA